MNLPHREKRPESASRWTPTTWSVLLVFLVVQLGLQAANSAFTSEFARTYDEAGHYVTGLMMHDFISGLDWSSPVDFAENYYVHYPKVAIGHWPPVFYLIQASWTLALSPSRASIMVLMAVLTSLLAFTIYRFLLPELGRSKALAAGVLLLLIPLIQAHSSVVMIETTLALVTLVAAISFAKYLDSESWAWSVAFTLFSVLAIMTKANGIALAAVPPLSLVISGRYPLMKKASFWLPPAVVLLLCGPWYYLTLEMLKNGPLEASPQWRYTRRAVPAHTLNLLEALGAVLIVLAIIGLVARLVLPWKRRTLDARWAALASLLFSAILFHWIVPASLHPRHMILALPPLLCFVAAGYHQVESHLRLPGAFHRHRKLILAGVVTAAFFLDTFEIPRREWRGFGIVAETILERPSLAASVLLISSDSDGEGAFVSEIARREPRPGHIVLRSSKVLARSRWIGRNYTPFFETTEDLSGFLRKVPIGVVVLDHSVPASRHTRDLSLLRLTIEQTREHWDLLGRFSVTRDGVVFPEAIHLYSQKGHQNKPVGEIRIDMSEMLGRHIERAPKSEVRPRAIR